jgi:peptidoglycan/xylan/chitin deacetylase (PgdA/CDA1 family)
MLKAFKWGLMAAKSSLNIWFMLGSIILASSAIQAQQKQVTIRLTFLSPISSSTKTDPAVLKFNKEFAFSFTLDDGLDDAYTLAFPLLNGGYSDVDKQTYPGLFFTDGCGTKIPFTAGVSWYTSNSSGLDIHNGTPGYLTYSQASFMYQAGWDFYNHSYNHPSATQTIDYIWQLVSNHQAFKSKTGIEFRYCVPPSGNVRFIDPAFSLGYLANITSDYSYSNSGRGADVTFPVPLPKPVYWRNHINSNDENLPTLINLISAWVQTTGPDKQKWWNEYTHRVAYTNPGGSLEFPVFKGYMEYMESEYGHRGHDNGWFANSAEVIDYMLVRDNIKISVQTSGTMMEIKLDYSKVPSSLRYYDVSLILGTTNEIASATVLTTGRVTYSKKSNHSLVNIDLPDSQFSGTGESMQVADKQLSVYPNPASQHIRIAFPDFTPDDRVILMRIDGTFCATPPYTSTNGDLELDLSSAAYSTGTYILTVHDRTTGSHSARFILIR